MFEFERRRARARSLADVILLTLSEETGMEEDEVVRELVAFVAVNSAGVHAAFAETRGMKRALNRAARRIDRLLASEEAAK